MRNQGAALASRDRGSNAVACGPVMSWTGLAIPFGVMLIGVSLMCLSTTTLAGL